MENYETFLNNFLYKLKHETVNYLLKEDVEYNEIYDEVDEILDSITSEYPQLFEQLDNLISKITELENFESEYLYKQGYKDCFKLLKLLDS